MIDAGRAIVGSVFAASGFRGQGLEERLVEAVIQDAQRHPNNDRVECQTLFSTAPAADQRFIRAGFASRVRHYLVRPLEAPVECPARTWSLRALRREDLAAAAQIIHRSHVGSLDAALNLTYATPDLLPRVRGDAGAARGMRPLRSRRVVHGRVRRPAASACCWPAISPAPTATSARSRSRPMRRARVSDAR